jgi:hypothetical protein
LVVHCPSPGPLCLVTGTATEADTGGFGFTTVGHVQRTIGAGKTAELTVSMTNRGVRLLRRVHFFMYGLLDIIAQAGKGLSLGDQASYNLDFKLHL